MARNHPQIGSSSGKTGEQPMLGFIPVTHFVARETLLQQQSRVNNGTSIYGVFGNSDRVFDIQRAEIAFSIAGSNQVYPGDFGRSSGYNAGRGDDIPQHSAANVLTTLNGLEIGDNQLDNARSMIMGMNLDAAQTQELIRDIVSNALEYRGITVFEKNSRDPSRPGVGPETGGAITIQVGGVITLPVLHRNGIRVGSLVEAVPMTPEESYDMAENTRAGRRFVTSKAQMMIREVTRESVISRICSSAPLFFKYYDKMVAAFGSNSLTKQRIAAINGMHRFALFSAAQAIGFFVEKGIIRQFADAVFVDDGNPSFDAGGNVQGDAAQMRDALKAGLQRQGTARLVGPSSKYSEISAVLAVLLGVIPHSNSTHTPLDSVTRAAVNSDNKRVYMDIAKAISRRCINPGNIGKERDHLHGIAQLTLGNSGAGDDFDYKAWTVDVETRGKIANTASIGGKLLQFQLNQPTDLVTSILASCSVETRNIIGGAISSGKYTNSIGGVDVLLSNVGKIR